MPPARRVVGGGTQGADYGFLVNFFARCGASRPSGHTPQHRANIVIFVRIGNLWARKEAKRPCSVLKSAAHPAVLLVVSSAPPAQKGTCSAARPPQRQKYAGLWL